MTGIIGADGKVGSSFRNHFARLQHELANLPIVAGVKGRHPLGHRNGVHCDRRMVVVAKIVFRRLRDRAIAECGALGAAGNDSDVFHHGESQTWISQLLRPPAASPA